jgi:hypothetical protein
MQKGPNRIPRRVDGKIDSGLEGMGRAASVELSCRPAEGRCLQTTFCSLGEQIYCAVLLAQWFRNPLSFVCTVWDSPLEMLCVH